MRKKTEAKKREIMLVAQTLFREMGYQNTSMNEIATRVGGSKATLYSYFPSKVAIFTEVVRDMATKSKNEMNACVDDHREYDPLFTGIAGNRHEEIESIFGELDIDNRQINETLKIFGMKLMKIVCSNEFLEFIRLAVSEAGRSSVGALFYQYGPKVGEQKISHYLEEAMQRGLLRKADPHVAGAQLLALLKSEVYEPYLFEFQVPMDEHVFEQKIGIAIDAFMLIYQRPTHTNAVNTK